MQEALPRWTATASHWRKNDGIIIIIIIIFIIIITIKKLRKPQRNWRPTQFAVIINIIIIIIIIIIICIVTCYKSEYGLSSDTDYSHLVIV